MLSFTQLKEKGLPRVLVVSREEAGRAAMHAALSRERISVHAVDDRVGAYWALKHFEFELIVLDCEAPVADEEEFRHMLRDEPLLRSVPLVVMARPFTDEELAARVRDALARGGADPR